MRSSIAILAASAMGALAQETSTANLFLGAPAVNGQEYVGSVISAGPSDTTYAIMCTASVCGSMSSSQTITIGPSHLDFNYVTETMGLEATASETCDISGTSLAVCHITANLDIQLSDLATTSTAIVITTSYSGSELAGVPVTLTAGVEKLSAATSASASGSGSSTASGSSSRASSSGSAASSSAASSASAASTSSTSGASSTMASGRGGDILAMVMFSAVSVSIGALMML